MSSDNERSSLVHCYRAGSQQLLGGLIVAIMFLLVAVAELKSSNEAQLMPQTSSVGTKDQQRLLAAIRTGRIGSDNTRLKKLKSAAVVASKYSQTSNMGDPRPMQSAIMKIDVPEISTTAKSNSSLTQILKLIARNGRHPNRSYCFQTSSKKSLQTILPLANLMVDNGSLTADQLSFRITTDVPSSEIWLEIRATTDDETVAVR